MTVYIDTSVVLSRLLNEPRQVQGWGNLTHDHSLAVAAGSLGFAVAGV